MSTKTYVSLCVALVLLMGLSTSAKAVQKSEHEAQVKEVLQIFHDSYDNAEEVKSKAAGVVVCPKIKKIGFGVGLERGVCSLLVDDKTESFWRVSGASFGLIAGIQNNAVMMTFNTQEALDKFMKSDSGFDVGVDLAVSVATVGVGGTKIDLGLLKTPTTTFVVDRSGLMADLSLEGSRFKMVDLPEDAKGDMLSVVAMAEVGSDRTTGGTTRVSIGVDEWTSGEARAAVYKALSEGGKAAAMELISEMEPCGVVKQVGKGKHGVPLRWCAAYRAPGGEFRVTVGTTEPMGWGEVIQAAKKEDEVISQFRMVVNEHLDGDGVLLVGADYEWDEDDLQVSIVRGSFDPIKLTSVTAYDPKE